MLCIKIFFGLVHASYGLPEGQGQAVKLPFFALWIDKKWVVACSNFHIETYICIRVLLNNITQLNQQFIQMLETKT